MGTRGLRIVKFKGRYWIFYNHWDSYPDGMGKSLVNSIPTDPEEYKKWLQQQRDFYTKWDTLLQEQLLCVKSTDIRSLFSGEPSETSTNVWGEAFDERIETGVPSYEIAFCDSSIEWTWTIDLDLEVFSVDSGAHFKLGRIPRDDSWMKALSLDEDHDRMALPQYVPEDAIASLTLEIDDFPSDTTAFYKTLNTKLITPKSYNSHNSSPSAMSNLQWKIFSAFQSSQLDYLSPILLGWTPQDLAFRELSYSILCLAAGNGLLAFIDRRRVVSARDEHSYIGVVTDTESNHQLELVSALGTGYHLEGEMPGSSPDGSRYWLEGALICLITRLDRPGVMEKAIADAVRYGREHSSCSSFNALLISIEHLVLIKSLPDGCVEHTDILPLIEIPSHLSKDARMRYGDDAVNAFYEAENKVDEDPKSEGAADKPQSETESQSSDDADGSGDVTKGIKGQTNNEAQDQEENAEVIENVMMGEGSGEVVQNLDKEESERSQDSEADEDDGPPWTMQQTFMSLIQFFEAARLETLKPTITGRGLPNEIYGMILSNVSDTQTYNSCLRVSRQIRSLCQQRPIIMDNIALLERFPGRSQSEPEIATPSNAQQMPDFRAMELSTNREMDILLRFRSVRGDPTSYMVVVGDELNRKSFIRLPVVFSGLDVPAPQVEKPQVCRRDYRYETIPDRDEITGYFWDEAFEKHPLALDSSTREFADWWKGALEVSDIREIREGPTSDWNLPPNTRDLYAGYRKFRPERAYFHYLFVRLKKPSKYWNGLWDDLVREMKERLSAIDDGFDVKGIINNQVRGAHDPFVILIHGLEVRLFKWEQPLLETQLQEGTKDIFSASGALKELEPERVYSVSKQEDRKVIGEYLKKVLVQRMTKIEALKSEQGVDSLASWS